MLSEDEGTELTELYQPEPNARELAASKRGIYALQQERQEQEYTESPSDLKQFRHDRR